MKRFLAQKLNSINLEQKPDFSILPSILYKYYTTDTFYSVVGTNRVVKYGFTRNLSTHKKSDYNYVGPK